MAGGQQPLAKSVVQSMYSISTVRPVGCLIYIIVVVLLRECGRQIGTAAHEPFGAIVVRRFGHMLVGPSIDKFAEFRVHGLGHLRMRLLRAAQSVALVEHRVLIHNKHHAIGLNVEIHFGAIVDEVGVVATLLLDA